MTTRKAKGAVAQVAQVKVDLSKGNVSTYGTFGRRGTSFEGAWKELAEAYGGVSKLAEAIGVSLPTLYRWAVLRKPVGLPQQRFITLLAVTKGLQVPPFGE